MPELELSSTEKSVALTNALISGASVGVGVGVSTYAMITAGTAAAGAGVTVAAASAPFWIAGACAISGIIAVGLGIWAYKEYTESARKLLADIKKQHDRELRLQEEYEDALFLQALYALKHHFIFSSMQLNGLHTEDNMVKSFSFISNVIDKLKQNPALHNAIVNQKELSTEDTVSLRRLMQDDIKNHASISTHYEPKKPSYGRAYLVGAGSAIATFAAVMCTSWGVSSLIIGAGLATAAVAATPIVGWAILGGAIALGLIIGGAMAYYKYKNIQRENEIENRKAKNTLIKSAKNQVVSRTEELKKDLHTMEITLKQSKIDQLEAKNRELQVMRKRPASEIKQEKPLEVEAKRPRSQSLPNSTLFRDHANDRKLDEVKPNEGESSVPDHNNSHQ